MKGKKAAASADKNMTNLEECLQALHTHIGKEKSLVGCNALTDPNVHLIKE